MNRYRLRTLNETASGPPRCLSIPDHVRLPLGIMNTKPSVSGPFCQGQRFVTRASNTKWPIIWLEEWKCDVFSEDRHHLYLLSRIREGNWLKAKVSLCPTPAPKNHALDHGSSAAQQLCRSPPTTA